MAQRSRRLPGLDQWELASVARSGPPATANAEPRDFWLLEHDPLWLSSLLGESTRSVLLVSQNRRAFCGLLVHDVGLALDLGGLSFGRVPVRRHVLTGGFSDTAAGPAELAALLSVLAGQVGPRGVVFLQGVHESEPLRAALDDPEVRRAYFVVPHGPPYRRCRIALPRAFDAYLSSLKRSVRKDLKGAMRDFGNRFASASQFQVVTTPDELEVVLPELVCLSAKTYQGRRLGLDVGEVVTSQLRFGMRRGLGRLDLLRVEGKLISYQIGYVYRGTLHATHAGYDPEWADWSPGIVHLGLIIEGLCQATSTVRTFDFMYGESPYKVRLSNTFHRESHFYLIPRTARGFSTWLALRTVAHASRTAGAVLGRLRYKSARRELIRRRAESGPA